MSQESLVPVLDKSWTMSIFVDELDSSYTVRVKNSTLISTVIQDLINRIHLNYNWIEFGLWCESKKIWLLPISSPLSPFALHSDSQISFIKRFRTVSIQLPDLQIRQIVLDFSKTVFQTVQIVCRKIGIRHYEELSFQYRPMEPVKYRSTSLLRTKKRPKFSSQQNILPSNWSVRRITSQAVPLFEKRDSLLRYLSETRSKESPKYRNKAAVTPTSTVSFFSIEENYTDKSANDEVYFESFENSKLANSPEVTYEQALKNADIFNYRNYRKRAELRCPWMISELTLIEQPIENVDKVYFLLRYKYHNYYYLDERYDSIRINQIFHQAYWSVLSNETDCSEDEALILAGILLQIKKSSENERKNEAKHGDQYGTRDIDEEIDTILDKMHLELLGRCEEDVTDSSVTIAGILHVMKCPNYFFQSFIKYNAEIKDDGIHLYSKRKPKGNVVTTEIIPIKGNEIELRVKVSTKEFFILEILNLHNKHESISKDDRKIEKYKIKFVDKDEFVRWSTGCRLLSKSIDFTKIEDFQYEQNVVTNIIDMKRPMYDNQTVSINQYEEKLNVNDFISLRLNKPFKKRYILEKLVKFQRSYKQYNSIQSKIAYIKCWQTLRHAGLCYFQVTLNKNQEKELLGIGYNRLILANIQTGNLKKIWELSQIVTWNKNWELFNMTLEFSSETLNIEFLNMSESQTFHEYLGGYLFIMMRNSEKYSDLSEKTFRKLTARHVLRTL